MLISVIIPVFNDADRLWGCLGALARQTLPRDDMEVIVVDNGSKESPKSVTDEFPFCRLMKETKLGSYAARNLGLRAAIGDLIAFTDSDCLPDERWLAEGVALLDAEPALAAIGGRIEVFASDEQHPTTAELYDIVFGLRQEESVRDQGLMMTANLITRRKAFDRVGPFDDSLLSAGDHEWSERLAKAALPIQYAETVVVRHPARQTAGELRRQTRRHVGGRFDRNQQRTRQSSLLHKLHVIRRLFVPNFSKIFQARRRLRDRGLGLLAWLRVSLMIVYLQYSGTYELIRKYLGLRSERR